MKSITNALPKISGFESFMFGLTKGLTGHLPHHQTVKVIQ